MRPRSRPCSGDSPGSPKRPNSLRTASNMMISGLPANQFGLEESPTAAAKLGETKRPYSPDVSTLSTRCISSNTSLTSGSPKSALGASPRALEDFGMAREEGSTGARTPPKKQPTTSSEWVANAGSSLKSPVARIGSLLCKELKRQEGMELRFQPSQTEAAASSKADYTPLAKRSGRLKDTSKLTIQTNPAKDLSRKRIRELEEDEKIFDSYYWEEVLQEDGDGGKVVVCHPKDGGKTPKLKKDKFKYVMKMRSKKSLEEAGLLYSFQKLQERLLNLPPHANVLVPHEVLEDEHFYYVVMEKAAHACFFEGLLSSFGDGIMPASAIRRLMREILGAVSHVHREGMIHRDIKPDNLVVQECPRSPTGKKVMLIDFDHADPEYGPDSPKHQNAVFGTLRFNAPETFQGCFSTQSDLYSVGCILYLLVTGKMPYDDSLFDVQNAESPEGQKIVHGRLTKATIDFNCSPFPEEVLCRDLCRSLLAWEAETRPCSAEEALKHDWFTQEDAETN